MEHNNEIVIVIVTFTFLVLFNSIIYLIFFPFLKGNIALSFIIGLMPFVGVGIELFYFFNFSQGKSKYLESEWKGKKQHQSDTQESYKPTTRELKMKSIYEESVGAIATRQRKWTTAGVPGVRVTYPDTKIIFYKTFLFLKFDLAMPIFKVSKERYITLKLRYKDIEYIKNTHSNIGYFSGLEIKHKDTSVPRYVFMNTPNGGCDGLYNRIMNVVKDNNLKIKMKDK